MKKLCIVILSLTTAAAVSAQTKTVTNDDLEKFRRERVESEKKLKERYAEMGFPSPAEIEKRNAARRAEMEEYSDELNRQRVETRNDIVAEAGELRSQIAAIDAQIGYLRAQGGGYSDPGVVLSYGYAPYGYGRGGYRGGNRSILPQIRRLPPNMRTVQEYALAYPNSPGYFSRFNNRQPRGGRSIDFGSGVVRPLVRNNYGGSGYYRGGALAPVIVGGGYGSNDYSQDLIYLEQQRAGLLAQYNIVAEKARRAGIRLD